MVPFFGVVKWNLYPCSEATKRAAYITLVRPHLEYGSALWDPYKQASKNKLTIHVAVDNNITLPSWYEFHKQNVLKCLQFCCSKASLCFSVVVVHVDVGVTLA